jgi:DNA-binding transcriptional MocR family regulator
MLSVLQGSKNFEVESPLSSGGYFLWLKLADNVDVSKIKSQLEKDNIVVAYGEIFVQPIDREKEKYAYLKKRIRLGFSYLEEDVLVEGCKKIREAIDGAVEISAKF